MSIDIRLRHQFSEVLFYIITFTLLWYLKYAFGYSAILFIIT
jgi:hypothetical protein